LEKMATYVPHEIAARFGLHFDSRNEGKGEGRK